MIGSYVYALNSLSYELHTNEKYLILYSKNWVFVKRWINVVGFGWEWYKILKWVCWMLKTCVVCEKCANKEIHEFFRLENCKNMSLKVLLIKTNDENSWKGLEIAWEMSTSKRFLENLDSKILGESDHSNSLNLPNFLKPTEFDQKAESDQKDRI